MQPLFRAVKKASFRPDEVHSVLPTRRLPGNVPYLIDNIWEFLRPEAAPSRRHSVYASPSAAIALASASARRNNPEDYVVCTLELPGTQPKIAHILTPDAKNHADIDNLREAIFGAINADFSDLDLTQKLDYAPLFLPGVTQEEMREVFRTNSRLQALEPIIRSTSKFWDEAAYTPQPHNGELFFELPGDGKYRLIEIK